MDDHSQKTIFVLDHTEYFGISSEDYMPIDYLKGKTTSPTGSSGSSGGGGVSSSRSSSSTAGSGVGQRFSKTLWTCSVEAAMEYCRIVWDLFPRRKLIRFVVSDSAAHIVNTWKVATQNMQHVANAMAMVGVPGLNCNPIPCENNVVHGLRAAIEALAEYTESQRERSLEIQRSMELEKEKREREREQMSSKELNSKKFMNKGRIICITSARDNINIKNMEEIVQNTLLEQNNPSPSKENNKQNLIIDHCHLVIINVLPLNTIEEEISISGHGRIEISPHLISEVHTVRANEISNKLTHLILGHYDLASTTVTGIPMKEEQNANSSANYDVEILHLRSAHSAICDSGNGSMVTSIREGGEYETVTLKWCTPRGSSSADISTYPLCVAQNRVTPVDVTSRPSSCLVNFLLNGRSVLLEMPRKSGGRTSSHLLSARGGEIYIHSFQITRSPLDELPSINDGPGGKVTDYRIIDMISHMKAHRLVPLKSRSLPDKNLMKARQILYRSVRFFPLTLASTMIFNLYRHLPWMASFLCHITKENMDKSDEIQCQQNIFDLYTSATKDDILPFNNMSAISLNRLKGIKKSEQYRLLCSELELFTRCYSVTPHHKVIMENIQNVRAVCGDSTATKSESEANGHVSSVGKNIIRATTDSPLSPPHSLEGGGNVYKTTLGKRNNNSKRTLFDILSSVERSQSNKRPDFSGRLCTPVGQIAKLYPEFGNNKDKEVNSASGKEDQTSNTTTSKLDASSSIRS